MILKSKACLFGLLLPALLSAQEVGLLRLNPERPEKKTSVAVWGGVEEGWFRPIYAGTFQWSAGARAESVRHGERTSWMGSVSLEHKTGYGMLSSMSLEPGYFPVDLLEFTPGTKSRETGRLEAGFVTDLGYEYAAGIKASFQAGSLGKRTDVRHSAFGVDLQVEPTLTYVMDDNMGFAAAYVFRLKTQRVKYPGDENAVFLDKGLRYGTFLEKEGVFPVRETSQGFSGRFYSEEVEGGLEWIWKRGHAGGSDAGRFLFPGSKVSAFYQQVFLAESADHVIRVSGQRDRDQLRQQNAEGSGIAAVSDRKYLDAELKYEIRFLHGAVRRLGLALEGHRREDRALSPLSDQVKRNLGAATISSSFTLGALDLGFEVQAAGALWRDRGRSRDETTDTPYRRTEDWLRLMDYYMAPQVGTGGSLTYHFSSPQGMFLRLDGHWLHALRKTATGGQNREIGTVTVGYDF